MLGIDLDPQFAQGQPFAYLMATRRQGLQMQRWRVAADGAMSLEGVVLDGIRAGAIHDSGRLRFGPDGHLYVLTGDAGQGRLAQDPGSLNGKVLRLSPQQYRTTGMAAHGWGWLRSYRRRGAGDSHIQRKGRPSISTRAVRKKSASAADRDRTQTRPTAPVRTRRRGTGTTSALAVLAEQRIRTARGPRARAGR